MDTSQNLDYSQGHNYRRLLSPGQNAYLEASAGQAVNMLLLYLLHNPDEVKMTDDGAGHPSWYFKKGQLKRFIQMEPQIDMLDHGKIVKVYLGGKNGHKLRKLTNSSNKQVKEVVKQTITMIMLCILREPENVQMLTDADGLTTWYFRRDRLQKYIRQEIHIDFLDQERIVKLSLWGQPRVITAVNMPIKKEDIPDDDEDKIISMFESLHNSFHPEVK